MIDGGRRGDSKYRSAARHSGGLAPVTRRGVPTPVGTLSYRSNLQ
jgi:hypothetical protein